MIQVKSFNVTGEVVSRNKTRVRTLAENFDNEINEFLKGIPGTVIDIKTNVQFSGMQDFAFVTVLYQSEEPKKK